MAQLKGSQTEKNILTAFAGESQARNRYTYYSSKARDEGYIQISKIFEETANQEKEHAKRLFKLLEGGDVEIQAAFPAGKIASTCDNLLAAAAGELHEHSEMYPGFARTARQEGFETIAKVFEAISVAERMHDARFRALANNIQETTVFHKAKSTTWKCQNCGYTHDGTDAPQACPACAHPQAHFEVMSHNW